MAQADRFPPAIIAGKATKAVMIANSTYALNQGEIAMATDEDRVFIGDTTYRFEDLCNFVIPHLVSTRDTGSIMVLRSVGTPTFKR